MKKAAAIIIAIILIVIICICIFTSRENIENTNNENISTNETEINNEVVNEQQNEVVENEIVNKEENTQIEEKEENIVENTTRTETFEESPATAEKKAIDIVKKDWGNDSNVNFSMQGMDENGNYIVVVTNSDTVSLAFYTVNVSNKTFTKREMN